MGSSALLTDEKARLPQPALQGSLGTVRSLTLGSHMPDWPVVRQEREWAGIQGVGVPHHSAELRNARVGMHLHIYMLMNLEVGSL